MDVLEFHNTLLVGGPEAIPADWRVRHVATDVDKVKLRWCAGYEHFVPTSERRQVDGRELAVFVWATRTAIAE